MDYIWPKIGNEKVINILEKNLRNKKLSNFYIFSGIKNLGKFVLASDFAKNIFISDNAEFKKIDNLLALNSDFFVIERAADKKNISIEQIRDFITQLSSRSFLNSYRIAIIKDAENLNQNSANALLKVLEEPKNKLVIILTINDLDCLPKTILSRGQVLNFYPLSFDSIYDLLIDNHQASVSEAKNFAYLSLGKPALAIRFLKDKEYYNDYKEIFNLLLKFISSSFFERIKIIDSIYKHDFSFGGNFNLLEIWQGLIRDLGLVLCTRTDLIQNQFALNNLKNMEVDSDFILKNNEILKKSEQYLKSNINIKSFLEHIAVNA